MYTKQQRREIYLKALEAFTKKDDTAFMCHELSKAISLSDPFISHDKLLVLFPEWASCRPVGYVHDNCDSNIWEDDDTKGNALTWKEFNDLRETILCLAIAQIG